MATLLESSIQTLQYADLQTCIEGDQAESYEQSISFVVSIGQNPGQVIQHMRSEHGILPYPTSNRDINGDVLVTFWKLLELQSKDYQRLSMDDLVSSPVNEWPAVPVGQVGPLLVMGHCCPPSRNCWGIDPEACPMVWLTPRMYHAYLQATLRFLAEREVRPRLYREQSQPVAELRKELEEFDEEDRVIPIMKWMLTALPMSQEDRTFLEESIEEGTLTIPAGYTAAIDFIGTRSPLIDIREMDISPRMYERIPRNLVDRYKILCFLETDKEFYVAVSRLDDFECEDQLVNRLKLDKEIVRVQARANDILMRLERFENTGSLMTSVEEDTGAEERALRSFNADITINEEAARLINPKSTNTSPEELLEWLVYNSITGKASDIHIEQYREQTRFRTRIDGQLTTIYTGPIKMLMPVVAIIKNHCNMTLNNNDAQDGRFSVKFAGRIIDARVSAIPWRRKFQKITIRILDKGSNIRSLEDMGLPTKQLKIFQGVIAKPQGMIVVTGPTGSGKSTTLYAVLQALNKGTINVQTIEDPIEYEMEGLNQTQVDPNQDLTFYSVLRRILRADPDVVMVGEIRDRETAVTAAEAALTGHLILTTLHSLDSIRAVGRLLAMGVQSYMLADSLILLHAQRLVRRLCRCRREDVMTPEIEDVYREEGFFDAGSDAIPHKSFYKRGCAECFGTGYRGRLAVMELAPVNDQMRDVIITGGDSAKLLQLALANQYDPMLRIGLRRALSGATSVEECLRLRRT
ncbi:MAG: Flp pilus assembly complex ATPase component TadA [Opitutales bacterium]|nr:Flp pilus assembly complex ATPase component TadA [Opitutales bacterium]